MYAAEVGIQMQRMPLLTSLRTKQLACRRMRNPQVMEAYKAYKAVWEADSTDLDKQADYYTAKLAYDKANYEYTL